MSREQGREARDTTVEFSVTLGQGGASISQEVLRISSCKAWYELGRLGEASVAQWRNGSLGESLGLRDWGLGCTVSAFWGVWIFGLDACILLSPEHGRTT